MMYCTFAVLFIARACGLPLSIGQQVLMLALLLDMGRSATSVVGDSVATW